ncbi:glycine--tRNA ligase subunit beta [candidate division WOR-3 bacterium JGI_Cruoil_03_44_89]|uniref:Glycine--tRNA ligase beta subunit n=1 Tax=candidate division WOR-3 bacterium JGI_Cruoil_03_44_89 TaxID=1973748 RepID=A0A235BR75_UNCW3|nr:MAG: glycine--tRNA ligase subunit beta [candidate division WOR-3 bacterium JGI_Cruoil_03_44_89]
MTKDFLLEIGTEEIPASYLEPGLNSLEELLTGCLRDSLIHFGNTKKFYTPRRLAILIRDVSLYGEDIVTVITGPPKEIAFEDDKPTSQLVGFVRAHGVSPEKVKIIKKGKKEVIGIEKREKGCDALDILRDSIPSILGGIEFPRTMRWESSGVRFARPIRWIVCLFGKKMVKFQLAGVVSGRRSCMLRGEKNTTIDEPSNYGKLLQENLIIADPLKRKEKIESQIKKIAEEKDVEPIGDDELLLEVTNMVESPLAVIGEFDKSYLSLPDDVLRAALKGHQRYFWTERSGEGTNYFISVANNPHGDVDAIRKGNEKVLQARLEDAEFYLREDMKVPLHKRVEDLKEMIYDRKLGSLYDKTKRLVELSSFLCKWVEGVDITSLRRAALLSKTDLTTNMIKDGKEFTKLEGIIGAEYAQRQGEDKKVVDAIGEHYLPRFANDELPETKEGRVLAIADKVDTLVGGYMVSGIPTSSKDPRGMKRDANGIVRVLLERSLSIPLEAMIRKSFSLYGKEYSAQVLDFIIQRCRQYLLDRGISYNVVMSISPREDILTMKMIADSIVDAGDIQDIVMVTKRMNNILKGVKVGEGVVEEYLKEPEEKKLFSEARVTGKNLERCIREKKFKDAIFLLRALVPHINKLFDKILIMARDQKIKNNRLALLSYVHSLFQEIADFKSYGIK